MRNVRQGSMAFLAGLLTASCAWTAPPERPTLNHTADPRPNILPDWIYNHNVPYRLRYNRPRLVGGAIAYHIAPSSQEAMAWAENMDRGYYDGFHNPPLVKRFCYPKPWEALNTGPRPNTPAGGAACCPAAVGPDGTAIAPEAVVPAPVTPGTAPAPAANSQQGTELSEPVEGGRDIRPNKTVPEPEVSRPDLDNALRTKQPRSAHSALSASRSTPRATKR